MKILVVDDDAISRRILTQIISSYGSYDVAIDGKEAVEIFKLSCDEQDMYTLIFLDITMPELDGQGTLKQIRALEDSFGIEGLKRTKIIMTTASDDFNNISTAFNEQCDAYLVKPVSKSKVEENLKRLKLI